MTAEDIETARDNVKYWNQLFNEWKELDRNPLPGGSWCARVNKSARTNRSQVEKTIEEKQRLEDMIEAAAAKASRFEDELDLIDDDEIRSVIWWRVFTKSTWRKIDYIVYGTHSCSCAKMALTRWLQRQDPVLS
ncbi:MAG: hypothetical protein K6D92_04425 [Erysipelotrichaceae bacterium]|nr:hypothetical protein [Erysipelotrichaceae bacterium]